MKHQYSTSSVSRSFLSPDFSVSRLFPLPDASNACGWQWQGFRAEYAQNCLRKILPETALPSDLSNAVKATCYLCIRTSGTGGWWDEPQLYHRLLPLPQEKNNIIGFPFLVAQISFITNRLNRILSLLHILNAIAIIISRL